MKRLPRFIVLPVLLLAGLLLLPASVRGQEIPVRLERVEPPEALPGNALTITIWGGDFGDAQEVQVFIPDVEVQEAWVESPEQIQAAIIIPEGAPPGPRPVEVVLVSEQAGKVVARLDEGFVITALSPPGEPPSQPGGGQGTNGASLILLSGVALLVWAAGFAVGRALTLRSTLTWKRLAELQWQVEAKTNLPEPRKACTWTCQASASTGLLKRWQIEAISITPLPVSGGKTPSGREITGEALKSLNEAVRIKILPEDEAQRRQHVKPAAEALVRAVLAWGDEGKSPPAIRLDVRLQRDVKWGFRLYHCENTSTGLQWKERRKWKGALHQPAGDCLGVLRGPTEGEKDFPARLQTEIEALLMQFVKSVRLKI